MAAVKLARLSIAIGAQTKGLRQGLAGAQKQVKGFSGKIGGLRGKLSSLGGSAILGGLNAINRALKLMTAAAAAAVTALTVKGFIDVDKIAKTAGKLGLSTEALTGLQFGAGIAGAENMEMALQRMTRRTAEAAQGMGEAQGALKELGLDAKAMAQLSPDEQLKRIADAMAQVPSQNDKIRLAFKLFDSEGVGMVNLLKEGSAGIDAFRKRADELGLSVSRVDAAKIEQANDAIMELKSAFVGLFRQFAVGLAPFVTAVAQKLTDMVAGFTDGKTAAERFIGAIKNISMFVASSIDFVEKMILHVNAGVTGLGARLLFEFTSVIDGINELIAGLPQSVKDKLGLSPSDTSGLHAMIDSMDGSVNDFQKRIDDINANPRAAGVRKFFDEVEKRAQENAEKIAEAANGGGMQIGNDIAGGFERGLEAIEARSSKEFSTILGALQGGAQSNAAREAVERSGREWIAAGKATGELAVAPGSLEAAARGVEREAGGEFMDEVRGRATGVNSANSVLSDILTELQTMNKRDEKRPKVAPAGL